MSVLLAAPWRKLGSHVTQRISLTRSLMTLLIAMTLIPLNRFKRVRHSLVASQKCLTFCWACTVVTWWDGRFTLHVTPLSHCTVQLCFVLSCCWWMIRLAASPRVTCTVCKRFTVSCDKRGFRIVLPRGHPPSVSQRHFESRVKSAGFTSWFLLFSL